MHARAFHLLLSLLAALSAAAAPAIFLQPCPEGGHLPDALTTPDGTVHLVFHRSKPGSSDLFHATWNPATKAFSDPVRINSTPGSAVATGAVRGAHLALAKDNSLHVAWMGSMRTAPEENHARIPMLYARSLDAGQSFSSQRNLVTTAYGLDGGGTITADPTGHVHVLWHANGDENTPTVRSVVIASSEDSGASFAPERTLQTEASGVCPCCGIRAASSPDGSDHFVLFRSAPLPDERGIRIFSFNPAKPANQLVHSDSWKINTCPVSSGSFAFNPTHFAVSWESNNRVTAGIFDRPSGKLTRSLTAPDPAAHNNQKHPSLALAADGSVLLAWLEVHGWGNPGTLRWQHFNPAGLPTALSGSQKLQSPWTRPSIISHKGNFTIFH
ncbi:MAG: hypothetical protein O3A92_10800 [Verrucomicrobia bacterium]|nr:hypothetical protein [Verrucomicrobiota bacterium]